MQPETVRRLAWFAVIAGVCLNVSTMLAQPVANSAAHLERARLQWSWLAADVERQGRVAWDRLQDLPASPSLAAIVARIQPLDDRRPETTGSTTGTVTVRRGGSGDDGAAEPAGPGPDPGALDAGARDGGATPQPTSGSGPIEEITITFEVNASWHYMKGEIRLRPGKEPETLFAPTWRPILLMMSGVGLAMLVIGGLGLVMMRRDPAGDDANTRPGKSGKSGK